ncbi:hypothetical protein BT96DRAFT_1007303 [Gymnopus androsaceus JB14]|uniref:Uncharacterized protein n=1 Tax=Gymnopus androsaceus JB14 TaxID=1447944 RepID=A0A6A4GHP9_9AGAR|nr:hypothetical protein BT96DRAFT_1007303 [Gymnopus androsaceus JB14]
MSTNSNSTATPTKDTSPAMKLERPLPMCPTTFARPSLLLARVALPLAKFFLLFPSPPPKYDPEEGDLGAFSNQVVETEQSASTIGSACAKEAEALGPLRPSFEIYSDCRKREYKFSSMNGNNRRYLTSSLRLKALPLDLLIEVFSHLHRSSDLLHVALVFKTFYACSIRLLYRQVQISSPFDFLNREPFWEKHGSSATLNLTTSPRSNHKVQHPSLKPAVDRTCSVCSRTSASASFRALSSASNEFPNDHHPTVASPTFPSRVRKDLFPDVRDRILSFENLKSLAFRGCGLTDDVYHLLSQLRGLRSFTVEGCMMPSVFIRSFESDDDAAWTSENDEEKYALVELIIRGNISGTTQYFDLNSFPDAGAPTA